MVQLIIYLFCVGIVSLTYAFTAVPFFVRRNAVVLNAGKPVDVTFEPAGKSIVAEQGELIEAVAKRAAISIPFKCKQGRCNSCEVRLNGKVSAKVCQGAAIPGGPTKKLSIVVINKKPL